MTATSQMYRGMTQAVSGRIVPAYRKKKTINRGAKMTQFKIHQLLPESSPYTFDL